MLENDSHPPVRDSEGRIWTYDGRGGWTDGNRDFHLTWDALTQLVGSVWVVHDVSLDEIADHQ